MNKQRHEIAPPMSYRPMPTPSPGTPKRPVAGRRSPLPSVAGPFGESESPVRAKSRGWLRYQGNRPLTGPMHTSQEARIQLMENTIQFQLEVFVNKRFDPFLNAPGEPREFSERRTPTGLLGNRVNNWTLFSSCRLRQPLCSAPQRPGLSSLSAFW